MGDSQLAPPARPKVDDVLTAAIEIACDCGRSGCGEVIALPWNVYDHAKRERWSLLVPGHEVPRIKLGHYDAFVVVADENPTERRR
jgi:hypothetical protein